MGYLRRVFRREGSGRGCGRNFTAHKCLLMQQKFVPWCLLSPSPILYASLIPWLCHSLKRWCLQDVYVCMRRQMLRIQIQISLFRGSVLIGTKLLKSAALCSIYCNSAFWAYSIWQAKKWLSRRRALSRILWILISYSLFNNNNFSLRTCANNDTRKLFFCVLFPQVFWLKIPRELDQSY